MAAMRAVQPLLEEAEAQAGAMRGREWGRLLPLCPQVAEGFRRALERGERRAARAAAPPPPPGAEGPVIEIPAAAAGPAIATPARRPPVETRSVGTQVAAGPPPADMRSVMRRSVWTQAPAVEAWRVGLGINFPVLFEQLGIGPSEGGARATVPPPAEPAPPAGPAGASPS